MKMQVALEKGIEPSSIIGNVIKTNGIVVGKITAYNKDTGIATADLDEKEYNKIGFNPVAGNNIGISSRSSDIKESQAIKKYNVGDILVSKLHKKYTIFKCIKVDNDYGVVEFYKHGVKENIGFSYVRTANIFEKIYYHLLLWN